MSELPKFVIVGASPYVIYEKCLPVGHPCSTYHRIVARCDSEYEARRVVRGLQRLEETDE